MKIRHADHREEIKLEMTPMIDIVFQLLVFFVFTFKIILPEGDFSIRMPTASASQSSQPSETPLLKVRLRAEMDGSLSQVQMGELAFDGETPFLQLQTYIRGLIDDSAGPGSSEQEVELDCDYGLKYRYTINALTAITGYVENGQQHKLIEKVRFTPVSKP